MEQSATSTQNKELTVGEYLELLSEEQSILSMAKKLGITEECTWQKGYISQPIYLCKTCTPHSHLPNTNTNTKSPGGICLACALNCHKDHDIHEVGAKRAFRCDCGNSIFPTHGCALYIHKSEVNKENVYGHNFSERYCYCEGEYDEKGDFMIQCIVCQDWYHLGHLKFKETLEEDKRDTTKTQNTENEIRDFKLKCEWELVCSRCLSTQAQILTKYESLIESEGEYIEDANSQEADSGEEINSISINKSISKSIPHEEKAEVVVVENVPVEILPVEILPIESISSPPIPHSRKPQNPKRLQPEGGLPTPESPVKKIYEEEVKEICRIKGGGGGEGEIENNMTHNNNNNNIHPHDILIPTNINNILCKCTNCLTHYKENNIMYLLDDDPKLAIEKDLLEGAMSLQNPAPLFDPFATDTTPQEWQVQFLRFLNNMGFQGLGVVAQQQIAVAFAVFRTTFGDFVKMEGVPYTQIPMHKVQVFLSGVKKHIQTVLLDYYKDDTKY